MNRTKQSIKYSSLFVLVYYLINTAQADTCKTVVIAYGEKPRVLSFDSKEKSIKLIPYSSSRLGQWWEMKRLQNGDFLFLSHENPNYALGVIRPEPFIALDLIQMPAPGNLVHVSWKIRSNTAYTNQLFLAQRPELIVIKRGQNVVALDAQNNIRKQTLSYFSIRDAQTMALCDFSKLREE